MDTGSTPVLTTKRLNKMNKTNIPLISMVLLVSVAGIMALILRYESQQKKNILPKEPPIKELQEYKIFTLNGCEYIVVGTGQYRWGSHKGDCKNPIHYTK